MPIFSASSSRVSACAMTSVLLPVAQHLGVEDRERDLAGQVVDGIADEGGVEDVVLGHEALAGLVAPVARLAERALHVEVVHVVGQLVHHLHADGGVAGADLVAHVVAVAVHAGNGEGVQVLAPVKADLVVDHLRVVAEAAGGHDDLLAGDGDLLAVLVRGDDAAHGTLVVGEQLLARALEHELDAQVGRALGHALDHRGSGAGTRLGAVLGLHHVPGVLAVGIGAGALAGAERRAHGVEHDAHVLQPLDGVAALEVVRADQARVDLVVGVEHVATEQLAGRDLDHRGALHGGACRAGAHAHVGGAAGVGRLLERDDARASLRCGNGCCQAGKAGGHYDDVCLELLCHGIPPRINPALPALWRGNSHVYSVRKAPPRICAAEQLLAHRGVPHCACVESEHACGREGRVLLARVGRLASGPSPS